MGRLRTGLTVAGAALVVATLAAPAPMPKASTAIVAPAVVIDTQEAQSLAAISEGRSAKLVAVGDDAKSRNDTIGVSRARLETMRGFTASAASQATARQCLAQAIFYEAGYEPESGRRAVAQVVLNRVRHPAYPNSVCGVVYQGVNDPVCQFSFTCDGSLARRPSAAAWAAADRIAGQALAGHIERSVGSATHYHADYVVPRWAYTLGKVTKIGQHIFYRFNGGAGSARAFTQLYAGRERIPEILATPSPVQLADGRDPVTGTFENGLTVAPSAADRHAPADIGGRLDTTKGWKLELPAATQGRYRQLVAGKRAASDTPAEVKTATGDAATPAEPAA